MKNEEERLKEIEEIYLILEQESAELQELFAALSLENPDNIMFIECGNTYLPPENYVDTGDYVDA